MFRNLDFILLNLLAVALAGLIVSGGCGTCVGNPECTAASFDAGSPSGGDAYSPSGTAPEKAIFQGPIDQYNALQGSAVDCGSFTGDSTVAALAAGRACIENARSNCLVARYLMDEVDVTRERLVSFVGVEETSADPKTCQLRVHTVSEQTSVFIGDREKTCSALSADEVLALACGILTP
jgi:hypothetical protein